MAKAYLFDRLDVNYPDDPRVIEAGLLAELLNVRARLWVKSHLTDGVVTTAQLPRVAVGFDDPQTLAAKLVGVGLWEEFGDGWRIVGWLDDNRSAAEVAEIVEKRKQAGLLGNHSKYHGDKPDPTCPHCASQGGTQGAPDNGSQTHSPESESDPSSDASSSSSNGGAAGACAVIARRRTDAARAVKNPKAYAAKVLGSVTEEHLEAARALEASNPSLTAEQLADRLEPPERATVPREQSQHVILAASRRRDAIPAAIGAFLEALDATTYGRTGEFEQWRLAQIAQDCGTTLEVLEDRGVVEGPYGGLWMLCSTYRNAKAATAGVQA